MELRFGSKCWIVLQRESHWRRRYGVMRVYPMLKSVFAMLALILIAGSASGLEAGEQLYPEQKRGLDFDIVSKYSDSAEAYDIVVLVGKKGKLRRLEKLELEVRAKEGETVLMRANLNIRPYKEELTIQGRVLEKFTGTKFSIKSEYIEGTRLRLELPGFVYIARLKDFVHAKKA
jgi:hypothetical protein